MALAGGNDKSGWSYLSKDERADSNGDGNQDGTLVGGGKSTHTYEPGKFSTLNDLLKAHPQYDLVAKYKFTFQQVKNAFSIGLSNARTNYQVLLSNCVHTVGAALSAVGLYGDLGAGPNYRFESIQRFIKTGSSYTPTRVFLP